MSYLKMLGLGARGKLSGAAGLFSTAVISGSSSAPNLRVCIPAPNTSNIAALEGFGGVPAIRPLETLHNALSLRQLDAFLERVTAAPGLLGAPPAPLPPPKPPSPTNSVGWSGPSSLMSSSGELPSALSSAGPSSPNSNYASTSDKNPDSSTWSKNVPSKLPQWDGEAATLCALDAGLRPLVPHADPAGSSISGDVTPVSATSELEFNSNEATAGSITDHDLLSAEGEDDEETLSADPNEVPLRLIKNDLSPLNFAGPSSLRSLDHSTPSTAAGPSDFYGLNAQQTKESFYKDMPSSSKNFNIETDFKNKCSKVDPSDLEPLNVADKNNGSKGKSKKNETLNNGSRRYSDSSTQKINSSSSQAPVAGSRFTTTLVAEDLLKPSTSSKSNNNLPNISEIEQVGPLVTKANNVTVKPGFTIADDD